jgi:hypothetical protein
VAYARGKAPKVGALGEALHLTRDRPDRFYKPVRSNFGLLVPAKEGGLSREDLKTNNDI